MSETLTLPGGLPGLLRRGSPVVMQALWFLGDPGAPCTVSAVVDDAEVVVKAAELTGGCYPSARVRRDEVALDLTDPTGRAHAAWWLAAREGLSVPAWPTWRMTGRGCWTLRTPWRYGMTAGSPPIDAMERRFAAEAPPAHAARRWPDLYRQVPGLTGLGAEAGTDDAEALRRVCLHVAGREVTRGA